MTVEITFFHLELRPVNNHVQHDNKVQSITNVSWTHGDKELSSTSLLILPGLLIQSFVSDDKACNCLRAIPARFVECARAFAPQALLFCSEVEREAMLVPGTVVYLLYLFIYCVVPFAILSLK